MSINDDEFDRPSQVFRRSPFNSTEGVSGWPAFGTGVDYTGVDMVDNPEPTGFVADDAIGPDQIAPGAVGPVALDGTPPAVPTGLSLSSETQQHSDGGTVLRLVATVTQPADTDLYGTWVEFTDRDNGSGAPDWDRPQKLFIPKGQTMGAFEGIAGLTLYWARARSVDIQGNLSAYTSTVSHTTVKDTVAPSIPQGFTLIPGVRGFAASWNPLMVPDLRFYELRYAPDDGTGTAPVVTAWTTVRAKATTVFVGNLTVDTLYWVQIRSVDYSGNVETSVSDQTAVDYLAFPDAGWTALLSVTPTLITNADIAANSITAEMIQTGALDADKIAAGTLRISPLAAYAVGIEILNASAVVIARWDATGIKIIDATDPTRYMLLDAGQIKFTTDGGATFSTAMTPDGINASAINFGGLPGGHNLVQNSSFELADYGTAASTFVFTDTTNWAAANRTVSPDNVTEGTELSITTPGYV